MIQKPIPPNPPIPRRAHAVNPDAATTRQRFFPDVHTQTAVPMQQKGKARQIKLSPSARRGVRLLAVGMTLMFALFLVGNMVFVPAVTSAIDHWNCGADKVCSYTLNVGHNGKSDFLTEYYQGYILIVEAPGEDTSKARVFCARVSYSSDIARRIVTLSPQYINPTSTQGKPDLVIGVEGLVISLVLYNTGDSFTWERPNQ